MQDFAGTNYEFHDIVFCSKHWRC